MGKFAHSTVNVDPKNLEIEAAIGFASTAGRTLATMKIRFNRAMYASRQALRILTYFQYLDAEFVSEDAWVREKRLITLIGVQIASAHTNLLDSHQGLSRPRFTRLLLVK